jgi:signal transduction histidine kinase
MHTSSSIFILRKVKPLCTSILLILMTSMAHAAQIKEVLTDAFLCPTDTCAIRKFDEAQELIKNDTHEALYDYFLYFYLVKINELDSADQYYEISQPQLAELQNWRLYFNSIDAKVNTLHDRGYYDEAVLVLQRGIEKATELQELYERALLHTKLCYTYHDMGLYENGVKAGKMAMVHLDTSSHGMQLLNAINAIAICFDDWGKPDSALYYHYMNLEIGLDKTDEWGASSTYNNLGNTYLKMNQFDSAQKYLRKSLELAIKLKNVSQLATVFNNLGTISMKNGDYEQARAEFDSALYYSEIDVFAPLEKKRDVYYSLSKLFENTGDMASAFKYQKLYYQYRDSMANVQQVERLKNLEIQAAESKRLQEKAEAELKLKNKNLWLVISAFLVILLLGLLRQVYLKRKQTEQEAKLKLQEERLRISRDLHDNIGAELTYISSIIDQKSYETKDPEKRVEYEQLSNSSRQAMSQLRETIWAIKTEEITLEKLVLKINDLSQKYTSGLGLNVQVKYSGDNPILKPAKVINLFRICQEGLNNAVKYAKGQNIIIEANAEDGQLEVQIQDDGNGFHLQEVTLGYGLKNMKERAEELGGDFSLNSQVGKGTKIIVRMPV